MEITQYDWGQCEIINKTKILTKQGSDKIHEFIPTKYQKYPFNTILKHANVLDKLNKLSWGHLLHLPSQDAYSIQIHVLTMTLADNSHKQKE